MPEKEEEIMKPVLLQEIIERVNEKGESPLDIATSYGVSKDTLRRRIKESTGILIDNKTKNYQDEDRTKSKSYKDPQGL